MIMVNCAMVSKKPMDTAVPMVGRFMVSMSATNLNLSLKFDRVFLLVGLVSFNRNSAQSVPMSEMPAAKKKGACGLNAVNDPPTKGPITNPNASDDPKIPNRLALFCGVAVSATMACATETFPPVSPSRMRAPNKTIRLRASAKSKKEIQVPARLITSSGFRPHLSLSDPKIGVAKNWAMENEAVNTPNVVPVRPNVLP